MERSKEAKEFLHSLNLFPIPHVRIRKSTHEKKHRSEKKRGWWWFGMLYFSIWCRLTWKQGLLTIKFTLRGKKNTWVFHFLLSASFNLSTYAWDRNVWMSKCSLVSSVVPSYHRWKQKNWKGRDVNLEKRTTKRHHKKRSKKNSNAGGPWSVPRKRPAPFCSFKSTISHYC